MIFGFQCSVKRENFSSTLTLLTIGSTSSFIILRRQMDLVTHSNSLPGSEEARDFVGADHGAELTLILINAPPGHGPNLHRHPYEEIFVVQDGRGTFYVDSAQVHAGAGDVVLAP